jgi:myosin heavy subunit
MAKIFSILTLLAAALALYLGLESSKRVKELQLSGERIGKKLSFTEGELTKTKDSLRTSEEGLAVAKATVEKANADAATAKDEAAKAKAEVAAKAGELEKANADLATVKKAIEEAFPGGGLDDVKNLNTKITDLTNKMKEETAKVAEMEKKTAELQSAVVQAEEASKAKDEALARSERTNKRYAEGIMQKGVRGRVMAVNAGWGFAVLSVGDRAGAAANKVMIVTRGGQAIGRVRITNVEATQSVADILPGTFVRGMYVEPGDQVIYTGDDKVKPEEAPAAAPEVAPAVAAPQPTLPQ